MFPQRVPTTIPPFPLGLEGTTAITYEELNTYKTSALEPSTVIAMKSLLLLNPQPVMVT